MAVPGKQAKQLSSSTVAMGSDEDLKIYCQPCDVDGPRLPAHGYCRDCHEHLCETCFTAHKKHKLSRHHTLLDKDPSQPDNLTKPCLKHKKKMIEFYCHDHKALLCSVCVTLEHTVTSCKVEYIPDISDQIVNSKGLQIIMKAMDTITEQCHKKFLDLQNMTSKSNSSLIDVLANIKKFREEINQRLDELERQAEDAAKTIKRQNVKTLKTVETTCDDITKSLKASSDSIKQLNTPKQADTLFMELKFAEQMIQDFEKSIHQLSAIDVKEYSFKPNKAISTLLEKERSLGSVTEKSLKQPSPPPAVDVKSRQTSHQGAICIKTSKDKSRCCITGMALLPSDLFIITDSNNKAIKMVDTSSQSVTDHLQLDTEPHDVTSVTSTELAVTLPAEPTIQFISVASNKLQKKHNLKTQGHCYGISCCQGKLVVSFCRPAKLQILDMNGTILTTVKGENIFKRPDYVTTNTTSIYVSDWGMRTVTRLNWKGEVIGSYGGICAFGLTLSDKGTVFACDWKRNVIEEISGDCSTGKIVLKDLDDPRVVCWCAETSTFYLSCETGQDKHANFLHIFKLS